MTVVLRLLTSLLAALPLLAHAAVSEDDLLPIEEAFALQGQVRDDGRLHLHWRIAEGYYLYRHRLGAAVVEPEDLELGELQLPDGERHHDEFFGDVETYRDRLAASAALVWTDGQGPTGSINADFQISFQGCADVGVCYPPHRQLLSLPVAPGVIAASVDVGTGVSFDAAPLPDGLALAAGPAPAADNPLAQLLGGNQGPAPLQDAAPVREPPLPAEQAFVFEAIVWSPTQILARFSMPPNYYLYRDASNFELRTLSVDDGSDGEWRLADPLWPTTQAHTDDHFGAVSVYFDLVEVPIPVAPTRAGQSGTVSLSVNFQGCQLDGICYPPMIREVTLTLPEADQAQTQSAQAVVERSPYVHRALVDPSPEEMPTIGTGSQAPVPAPAQSLSWGGLALALLLALGGGVILNLMPCVLPILSLKVMGLVGSGESAAGARRHALWYTAGVLASFAAVGLLVLALRAAGQALGWGFQLQQPLFVAVLVYVMVAIGLSLSGVFSVGHGLVGAGQGLTSRSGPAGDFFTGVLAVVVASPCTVPFMGSALAFAFAASPVVALAVFLALGLGLALPFLLIGFVPALASRLPRPGAWMHTLQQVLAFPLYLTAVWLLWVLGRQRGIDAVALVLVGVTVLAAGLWWWERNRYREGRWRKVLALLLLLAALWPLSGVHRSQAPAADSVAALPANWMPYSPERLASLRAEGRGVFIDMTADWCITCKMNERAVLKTERFASLMAQHDMVVLQGDWTDVDPVISQFLTEYDSVGVPLYVVFRPGVDGPGLKLPTVLTFGIVEQALGR
ncbi:MAG: thioredoxin family protein [Xanthomonadales bacterium]|nr:thioredoxin family protein [Xanthomonadales bacterium]